MQLPRFKILGTNKDLQAFEQKCRALGIPVSGRNSYFRDDYEHCLMPCYGYDKHQPRNKKLQTMSADAYDTELVYDLGQEPHLALALAEIVRDL